MKKNINILIASLLIISALTLSGCQGVNDLTSKATKTVDDAQKEINNVTTQVIETKEKIDNTINEVNEAKDKVMDAKEAVDKIFD